MKSYAAIISKKISYQWNLNSQKVVARKNNSFGSIFQGTTCVSWFLRMVESVKMIVHCFAIWLSQQFGTDQPKHSYYTIDYSVSFHAAVNVKNRKLIDNFDYCLAVQHDEVGLCFNMISSVPWLHNVVTRAFETYTR